MDETNNINILKEKLLALGAEEHELDQVINDVNTLALQRVLKEHLSKIDDPMLKKLIESDSSEELIKYIETHGNSMPKISEEELKEATEKTWADYFNYMESQN